MKYSYEKESITTANNQTRLLILYYFALFSFLLIFLYSVYSNFNRLEISHFCDFKLLNIILSYFYFGAGVTTKVFMPLVSILSITIVIKNCMIKIETDRIFNIFVFTLLFTGNVFLTYLTLNIDFVSLASSSILLSESTFSFQPFLSTFVELMLILQPFFICFEIYLLLAIILIGESSSPYLKNNLRRYANKILMLIFTICFTAYWFYI